MDGVPVYNASHIGIAFVFNTLKLFVLLREDLQGLVGFSSVLQIDMKEGIMKEFKGDATLGLISSKLTLEGPIIKDKTSLCCCKTNLC